MKNLINFKSILAYSICFAGMFTLVISCADGNSTDSRDQAEQENKDRAANNNDQAVVVTNSDDDKQFLMDAAEMHLEQISLGKLAQQKGNSDHVKELGKMMEADHTKSHNELKSLAQSKSISIPGSMTDNSRENYKKLDKETGNDFGKSYSKMMVSNHEDAIDLYEDAANGTDSPEIRNYASKQLTSLRNHLAQAEACKEKCDKMK